MDKFWQQLAEVPAGFHWLLTLAALLALALCTLLYLRAIASMLARQSDPCVILTVVHAEDRPTILQLVARNIGTGLAEDIRFEFSHSIPAQAFGLTEKDARRSAPMEIGPLIDGIPALGPGEDRRIDWGQYGGLIAALGHEPVVATCKFRKNGKKMRPVKCPLDIASFAGTIIVESAESKMARELAVISRNTGHIARELEQLGDALAAARESGAEAPAAS